MHVAFVVPLRINQLNSNGHEKYIYPVFCLFDRIAYWNWWCFFCANHFVWMLNFLHRGGVASILFLRLIKSVQMYSCLYQMMAYHDEEQGNDQNTFTTSFNVCLLFFDVHKRRKRTENQSQSASRLRLVIQIRHFISRVSFSVFFSRFFRFSFPLFLYIISPSVCNFHFIFPSTWLFLFDLLILSLVCFVVNEVHRLVPVHNDSAWILIDIHKIQNVKMAKDKAKRKKKKK